MYVRSRRLGALGEENGGGGGASPGPGGAEGGEPGPVEGPGGAGSLPGHGGEDPGDASPDVRSDDPFSGRPTGPFSGFESAPTSTTPALNPSFTVGVPGFASVTFSRDRFGISLFGIGISFDTRGLSLGNLPAPGTPGGGPGPSREGGAGNPGGSDWPIPSLPGLPPLAIMRPGTGGSPETGGMTEGLGAVTIPWLWIGAAAGVVLLSRQGGKGRRP